MSQITINQTIRFIDTGAIRQSGQVCGFIHRGGENQIVVSVTTGPNRGHTVYISEEWVIV